MNNLIRLVLSETKDYIICDVCKTRLHIKFNLPVKLTKKETEVLKLENKQTLILDFALAHIVSCKANASHLIRPYKPRYKKSKEISLPFN